MTHNIPNHSIPNLPSPPGRGAGGEVERKYMIEHLLRAVRDLDEAPGQSAQAAMSTAQYLCAADWLERNGLTRLQIIQLSGINPEDYTIKGRPTCATTSTPQ